MTIHLGGKPVGPGHPCYIIAEIGPNFCVSADPAVNLAELMRLVHVAHDAGADAVKLQLKGFGAGSYYSRENLDRPIDDPRSPFKTRREYVTAREPTDDMLDALRAECDRLGLSWSASPWDLESVQRLCEHRVPWVKVASASITDAALMADVTRIRGPVVLSTGMSTGEEIDDAVQAITDGCSELTLLHCLSAYPAPERECNLRAMDTLRRRYGVPVGWSDHTRGTVVSEAAVAMGADIIEKHITMDRTAWGPDHAASLEPKGFALMCRNIRLIESAKGDGVKVPMPSEQAARERLRRVG